jgi:hypothetical protein
VRLRTTLALLLATAIAPTSAFARELRPPAAVTGIGVRLIDPPPSSLTNPLARVYITGAVAAGSRLTARVEVSNTTAHSQTVSVYAAGASMQGRTFTFDDGHAKNELSSWTTLDRRELRLAPHTATIVAVAVKVPRGASRGERYSVVWAAVRASATASVQLVNRVGVRMYVSVGGEAAPRYTVSTPRASRSAGGTPRIRATIRNTGTGTISIAGSLTLTGGPGGMRTGPLPISIARPLAPGSSRRVTLRLTRQLPRGPWHVDIALASGPTLQRARAVVTFPAKPASRVRVHAAS